MADADKTQKTEAPSGKRLGQAHAKGQFAKAPELAVAGILIVSLVIIGYVGREKAAEVASLSHFILAHLHEFELTEESVVSYGVDGVKFGLSIVAPLFFGCVIAVLAVGGWQSGYKLTPKVLELNLNKLNLIAGWKNVITKSKFVDAGIDLLKMVAVAFVIWRAFEEITDDPIFHTIVPVHHVVEFIMETSAILLIRLIFLIVFIALINYLYQKKKTYQSLKMTKNEVKDENKGKNIDPKVKKEIRKRGIEIIRNSMLQNVETADVVVTNPTHYAIALRYERGRDYAPVVVAKGENLVAQRIKKIAKEHGVPMVENKPVARLLYRISTVGEAIPLEMYGVVAKILSHVYRRHKYYFSRLNLRRKQKAGMLA